MTDGGGDGISEKELTCAICTEILYQPLTLLDCLHTFCGACLKEWFKWQATSASSSRRGTGNPYTCPSCRESVRRTKADWRLNSLLEGFLKAHPDKTKTDLEKRELGDHYKPGEDVLLPVQQQRRGREDGADERLLAEVREMSLNDRRAERVAPPRSRQEQAPRLTESTLRAHDIGQPQIEHQPSLRSLLSASDENSHDVQAEILRSIYSEGLLEGIDLDNLTAEQEEELTEKIAEAYRRRHRHRDRSGNRERPQREGRSPRSTATEAEPSPNSRPATRENTVESQQQQQTRSRPPVSRPHLFEETLETPTRTQRRSRSSISQRSSGQPDSPATATPLGTRSATDLSQTPSSNDAQRERRNRIASTGRSVTEPRPGSSQSGSPRSRQANTVGVQETTAARTAPSNHPIPESAQRPPLTTDATSATAPQSIAPSPLNPPHTVRPAVSNSAFAPEPVEETTDLETAPSITCNRCSRPNIQYSLHYNCRWCLGGGFNLCLDCYRNGQGCNHWFGFGYRALERWHRTAPPEGWPIGFDRPHVMLARQYVKPSPQRQSRGAILEEGAFCDSCFSYANDGYWYCPVCLEGAWGFCDTCVKRGRHCTHPLTYVAHLNSLQGGQWDPAKMAFVSLPHLRQDSYVNLPVDTGCDVCQRAIAPSSTRFHCCECNSGDYDICNDCYRGLVSQGKISQTNGPNGWRRCLEGHRLAVIGFQHTPEGGHLRITVREPVGGCTMKDNAPGAQQHPPAGTFPPDGGEGMRCLAIYSYFPKEGVEDELAFPKYAELREVERKNDDWFVGVYAGRRNLFPANHVRIL